MALEKKAGYHCVKAEVAEVRHTVLQASAAAASEESQSPQFMVWPFGTSDDKTHKFSEADHALVQELLQLVEEPEPPREDVFIYQQ